MQLIKPILKIVFLMIFMQLLSNSSSVAQSMNVAFYYEKNIFENQFGGILSWQAAEGFQIGSFYQFSLHQAYDEPITNEFAGGYVNIPFYRSNKLALSSSIKMGIANRRFIIFVPSIETTLNINSSFSIVFIGGIRAGESLIGVKTVFNMFSHGKN